MKHLICTLMSLALTLALLCTAACADAHPSQQTDLPDSVKLLMTDVENSLKACEEIWSTELWVLDYVDRWIESGEMADLDLARQACLLAWAYLDGYPELEMVSTEEAQMEVMDLGYELDMVGSLMITATGDLPSRIGDIRKMLNLMDYDWQLAERQELCGQLSQALRTWTMASARDAAWIVNDTLLLTEPNAAKQLYAAYVAAYPCVMGSVDGWVDDRAELERLARANADELFDNDPMTAWQLAWTASNQNLEIMEANGIVPRLIKNAHPDDLLPMPDWYLTADMGYACVKAGENGKLNIITYTPGMVLEPCGFWCEQFGVPLAQVEAYLHSLPTDWIVLNENHEWLLAKESYFVQMIWHEGGELDIYFPNSGSRFGLY